MNQCHLARLLSQAPVQAEIAPIAGPNPSTLIEMFVSAPVAKTKEFFKKLKKSTKSTKTEKYYFEAMAIIESMNYDFSYADKKIWWSIH
ncbi:MAG: hypothetical protein LBC87_03890 [Fibromonadaceae bacterium]|jgi:hypothetical protein|nr:hypothetical protein [Fibromonadaceae bacterium]